MAETVDKKVKLRKWGPEDEGKIVGRVTASQESVPINGDQNNRLDVVNFDVTIAQIGSNGAVYGCTEFYDQDEVVRHIFFPGDVLGFVATAGLRATLHRSSNLYEDPPVLFIAMGAQANSQIELDTSEVTTDKTLHDAGRVLSVMKKTLEDHQLGELYRPLYYQLNTALGHRGLRSALGCYGGAMPLLADPEFSKETADLIEKAKEVESGLAAQLELDDAMQKILNDASIADTVEAFPGSRQAVGECERAIQDLTEGRPQADIFFLPIGYRPQGRSWPYMDAGARDDQSHYGHELAILKKDDSGRGIVMGEIEREVGELHGRIEHAQNGIKMLQDLHVAEREATEA
jgi:hypothetical protein